MNNYVSCDFLFKLDDPFYWKLWDCSFTCFLCLLAIFTFYGIFTLIDIGYEDYVHPPLSYEIQGCITWTSGFLVSILCFLFQILVLYISKNGEKDKADLKSKMFANFQWLFYQNWLILTFIAYVAQFLGLWLFIDAIVDSAFPSTYNMKNNKLGNCIFFLLLILNIFI